MGCAKSKRGSADDAKKDDAAGEDNANKGTESTNARPGQTEKNLYFAAGDGGLLSGNDADKTELDDESDADRGDADAASRGDAAASRGDAAASRGDAAASRGDAAASRGGANASTRGSAHDGLEVEGQDLGTSENMQTNEEAVNLNNANLNLNNDGTRQTAIALFLLSNIATAAGAAARWYMRKELSLPPPTSAAPGGAKPVFEPPALCTHNEDPNIRWSQAYRRYAWVRGHHDYMSIRQKEGALRVPLTDVQYRQRVDGPLGPFFGGSYNPHDPR